MDFLQNKFFFYDVLSESVGTSIVSQKLQENDEDVIFLLAVLKGMQKKVPECLKIDAQLDILRGLFFLDMN
jgi:hypothetical protein